MKTKEFNPTIESTSIRIIDVDQEIMNYINVTIEESEVTKTAWDWESNIEFTIKVSGYEMDIKCRKVEEYSYIPGDYDVPDSSKLISCSIYDLEVILWGNDGQEMNFEYITKDKKFDQDDFYYEIERICTI